MEIKKSTQLSIAVSHETGTLADVLGVVADTGANILAYAGYHEDDQGLVFLVTEENDKVKAVLEESGYSVDAQPAIVVRDDDLVGKGASMASKLAAAGINITTAYATAAGGEYITIYQADDVDALAAALA